MKVIVLGGDGFCGWPTALELSSAGHDVIIVDNLSRRAIDLELEAESLTPIVPIGQRIAAAATQHLQIVEASRGFEDTVRGLGFIGDECQLTK